MPCPVQLPPKRAASCRPVAAEVRLVEHSRGTGADQEVPHSLLRKIASRAVDLKELRNHHSELPS